MSGQFSQDMYSYSPRYNNFAYFYLEDRWKLYHTINKCGTLYLAPTSTKNRFLCKGILCNRILELKLALTRLSESTWGITNRKLQSCSLDANYFVLKKRLYISEVSKLFEQTNFELSFRHQRGPTVASESRKCIGISGRNQRPITGVSRRSSVPSLVSEEQFPKRQIKASGGPHRPFQASLETPVIYQDLNAKHHYQANIFSPTFFLDFKMGSGAP